MKPFLVFFILYSLVSCDEADTQQLMDGELPTSDLDLIESLAIDTKTIFTDLVFDDSINMSQFLSDSIGRKQTLHTSVSQKRAVIALMLRKAMFLSDRSLHKFPDTNQQGIAYSSGSKTYQDAQTPSGGTCNRDLKLHGLDCSGMIYQLALEAGILMNPSLAGVEYLSEIENWNISLQKYPFYESIEMRQFQDLRIEDLEDGDILVFGNNHIGIFAPGSLLIHSSGYPTPEHAAQSKPKNTKTCLTNLDKGPVRSIITAEFLSYFNKGSFDVLRIMPKCSGKLQTSVKFWYDPTLLRGEFKPYRVSVTRSGDPKNWGTLYYFVTCDAPRHDDFVGIAGAVECNVPYQFASDRRIISISVDNGIADGSPAEIYKSPW